MREMPRSALWRYGAALVLSGWAVLLLVLFRQIIAPGAFLLLVSAVVLSAWFGGFWPGLLATALGAVTHAFLVSPPYYSLAMSDPRDVFRLALFICMSVLLSGLIEVLHSTQRATQAGAAALRASEERFRGIVEAANEGLWILDAEAGTEYVNSRLTQMLGYTQEEMLGRPFQQFLDVKNVKEAELSWLRRTQAVARKLDLRFRRRDGSILWALVSTSPIHDGRGTLVGALAMVTDITPLKQIEEELRRANHSKDEFLAMLAHELRNPLAPLLNALHIMRRNGPLHEPVEQARVIAERQVRLLTRLVDDLLDVSRITRGTTVLRKETVELETIVERAVESSRPFIEERQHQLAISLPPKPIFLSADPMRLEQILCNLLNNAAKYTEDVGKIWLDAAREGEEAVIRVRDNGAGMPPEILPCVFDLFVQADRSLARSEGGLGIGLTLVKSLVEMHGGAVGAFSAGVDKGSEFVVRLPALREAVLPDEPALDERSFEKRQGCLRILVVDDNKDAVQSMAMLLEVSGNDVRLAHEGKHALELAQQFKPHVVLLDIGLPGMDGYEVARRLRQQPPLQRSLLIALTGYGQPEDRKRSRAAGFDYHLVKPVDPTELEELLANTTVGARS